MLFRSGTGYTGQQTVTVTHSTATANGTLSFAGTLSCQSSVSGTMQAFNPCSSIASGTTGTLSDSRDSQSYTVAKIGSTWWMTKNLAVGCNGNNRRIINMDSTNSHVVAGWSTSSAGDLAQDTSGNLNIAYMQCNTTYGAWYNYGAATAGTISGSSNSTNATSDICPSGWRLPTWDEQQAIISYTTAFSPVTGGYYVEGRLGSTGRGYWWSSAAFDDLNRYYLSYNGSGLFTGSYYRYFGIYVRCVRA